MTTIHELDTPALIVDLDIMERNLARVSSYAQQHQLRLRPHTKTHKIPELGKQQIQLGAAGLTVAKVSEAEVMLKSGTPDLLVAYPVIGEQKLQRLIQIAKQIDVTVALDSEFAARALSDAASKAGATVRVLVEVDAGLHRVGLQAPDVIGLAHIIDGLPGLELEGIDFYPGHIRSLDGDADAALEQLDTLLTDLVEQFEKSGLGCSVISGGSTPTLFRSHEVGRLNEIRPGTYIFNDRNTWLLGACALEDCAASILTTVVSTAVKNQMIIDGGSKTFSSDRCAAEHAPGFGYLPDAPQAVFTKMNEEHGFVDIGETGRDWALGERVRILPNHICVAVNLHEQIYGVRGEKVEKVWQVEGRGKLQ